MDKYINYSILSWHQGESMAQKQHLICEEPLAIWVQEKPYSVVMRTPGDELAHSAGLCLAEGLVDKPEDIVSLDFCDEHDINMVKVTLTHSRLRLIDKHLDKRQYISQTSNGISGKQLVEDLGKTLLSVKKKIKIDMAKGLACLEQLNQYQPLRAKTRAAHAAALFDEHYNLLSVAEDVGRHNALDKAVGKLFLSKTLERAAFLVLSSRISYELVQKAARAGIDIIFAVSRPTGLAVSLASAMNMTLASRAPDAGLFIYCGSTSFSQDIKSSLRF